MPRLWWLQIIYSLEESDDHRVLSYWDTTDTAERTVLIVLCCSPFSQRDAKKSRKGLTINLLFRTPANPFFQAGWKAVFVPLLHPARISLEDLIEILSAKC